MDADVIVVGAGPTGLMLAAELRLAGVRTVLLERQTELREIAKAGAFIGQSVELLRYRGLLERVEAAGSGPIQRTPGAPFGNAYLDFSPFADPPLWGVRLPQHRLEQLLDERARELGADIRRGHELLGIVQDAGAATVDVRAPDGRRSLRARYVVGCDGPRSRVRERTGIAFPGVTYPEVNRLGRARVHESVTQLPNGDLEVPGLGLVRAGFTRTERGVFALGSVDPEWLGIQTTENEQGGVDDNARMSLEELHESIRRVLGGDLPLGEVTRLTRYGFQARQAEHYRDRRIFVAGDAAHQFPATGIGINVGICDAVNLAWKLAAGVHGWAPAGLLDTYHDERHPAGARTMLQTQAQAALRRDDEPAIKALRELFAELMTYEQPLRHVGEMLSGNDVRYASPGGDMHPLTGTFAGDLPLRLHEARPVLLDLADRSDLHPIVRERRQRIDIQTATMSDRPADALLIRPDGYIAWAGGAADGLRAALTRWFG